VARRGSEASSPRAGRIRSAGPDPSAFARSCTTRAQRFSTPGDQARGRASVADQRMTRRASRPRRSARRGTARWRRMADFARDARFGAGDPAARSRRFVRLGAKRRCGCAFSIKTRFAVRFSGVSQRGSRSIRRARKGPPAGLSCRGCYEVRTTGVPPGRDALGQASGSNGDLGGRARPVAGPGSPTREGRIATKLACWARAAPARLEAHSRDPGRRPGRPRGAHFQLAPGGDQLRVEQPDQCPSRRDHRAFPTRAAGVGRQRRGSTCRQSIKTRGGPRRLRMGRTA